MTKHSLSDYFNAGPLATLLMGDPKGRILDQVMLLGKLEFTVSTVAEGTDLSYRTAKEYLQYLQRLGFVQPTRRLGNAQAYQFNINHMHTLIQWATEYQSRRNKK